LSIRRSRDAFDGQQIVLYSGSLEPEGNDACRSKTVSRVEDDGRMLIDRQFGLGPNGEERLMTELVMTRRAPERASSSAPVEREPSHRASLPVARCSDRRHGWRAFRAIGNTSLPAAKSSARKPTASSGPWRNFANDSQ
jgi:hypothetical protein